MQFQDTFVNTFLAGPDCPILDPPELETALHFLTIFTDLEDEFNRIELVNTGLFDLEHSETAQQLDLNGAIRAIKNKSQLAKTILYWIDNNDYPQTSQALIENIAADIISNSR